jgi:hypothetical protein
MPPRRKLARIADALRAAADLCITGEWGGSIGEACDAFDVSSDDLFAVTGKVLGHLRFVIHRDAVTKADLLLEVVSVIEFGDALLG